MNWTGNAEFLSGPEDEPAPPGDLSDPTILRAVADCRAPDGQRLLPSRQRTTRRVAKMILSERGIDAADVRACHDLPLSDLDLLAALAVGVTPAEMRARLPDPQAVRAMAALRAIRLPAE